MLIRSGMPIVPESSMSAASAQGGKRRLWKKRIMEKTSAWLTIPSPLTSPRMNRAGSGAGSAGSPDTTRMTGRGRSLLTTCSHFVCAIGFGGNWTERTAERLKTLEPTHFSYQLPKDILENPEMEGQMKISVLPRRPE